MRKILIILAIISMIYILNNTQEEYVIVPDESIRFRIIPNSNAIEDIYMKEKVKENLSSTLENIEKSDNINESRKNIINSIPSIKENITTLFEKNDYDKSFNINYGKNYFPEKIYNGVKYKEGNYESMVIEIGEAKGDNFWCVLFPPLCLIDAKENENVEYKFFISEIINKFLK